jgi:hypothetical protein
MLANCAVAQAKRKIEETGFENCSQFVLKQKENNKFSLELIIKGLLEKPPLAPPYSQYEEVDFKVLLIGKSFCGKTTLLESLCLNKSTTFGQDSYRETPGIEITHIYWPVKLVSGEKFFVFDLAMWDCGKLASAKYDYILPVFFLNMKNSSILFRGKL